jgi:RNA polymerase sigma-70 factor (sigma-E family)
MDFDEFAERSTSVLVGTAYLLTGNRQDAEDLAQETLFKAYRHWRKVRDSANPSAYAHRMLVNEFLSEKRRRRLRPLPIIDQVEDPGQSDFAADVDLQSELAEAIAELPMRERSAVVLRHYNHFTHAEIAQAMGITESAARSTVSRGITALRRQLTPTATHNEGTWS